MSTIRSVIRPDPDYYGSTIYLPNVQTRPIVQKPRAKLGLGIPWQLCHLDLSCYRHILNQFPNVSWFYNWRYDLAGKFDNYLPALYEVSHRTDNLPYFEASIPIARAHPGVWLLGNEPDRIDQSSTDPRSFYLAFANWKRRAGAVLACAPNIYWDQNGREWAAQFLQYGPGIYYFGAHLYPPSAREWVYQLHEIYRFLDVSSIYRGTPVVVTETNVFSWEYDEQRRLMDIIDQVIDTDDRLHGVCWYAYRHHIPDAPWRGYELGDDQNRRNELGDRYAAIYGAHT